MKKILTIAAALAMAAVPTMAEVTETDFTYAEERTTALSIPGTANGDIVELAALLRQETLADFAGSKITSINITSGYSTPSHVTVFVTRGLDEQPIVQYEADLTSGNYSFTRVALETPVDVTGQEPLYIGYGFTATVPSWPLSIDGNNKTVDTNCVVGVSKDEGNTYTWNDRGTVMGALCIGCTFTKDDSWTGVDYVSAATPAVWGGKGCIELNGAEAAVYTADGRRTGSENLAAGLYIVRTAAGTVKVMVK